MYLSCEDSVLPVHAKRRLLELPFQLIPVRYEVRTVDAGVLH